MEAALQIRSARAELLAGNVANADTPGYMARD
ncbi:MAG: flagellar basal body rod protein FlgB, partial [Deltaproteobacteria bacterium]|nr:flagellar basal body rod protein FlgB [Deltaproteobacteria bacterium]